MTAPSPQLALEVYGPPGDLPDLPAEPVLDWRARAACRGMEDDTFFPTGSSGPALEQLAHAKRFCRTRCPVQAECGRWALDTGQDWGVWGGLDENERRAIRESGWAVEVVS